MVEGNMVFANVEIIETRGVLPDEVGQLTCDSREVQPGGLFVALGGTAVDGHSFVAQAAERGACAAVVERWCDASVPQIRVADTLASLPTIAANFYQHPAERLHLTGITGSNGKTTSTYLMETIWKTAGEESAVIGTIEYRYGSHRIEAKNTTPLANELQDHFRRIADEGIRRVAMEVSSHGLALHRVDGISFDTALFTNLSQDHLDFHPTMEHYRDTKLRLFTEHLKPQGAAVINIDDETGRYYQTQLSGKNVITFAIDREADVTARNADIQLSGSSFTLAFPDGSVDVQTPLVGRHNIYNILGVAAAAWSQKFPCEVIQDAVHEMKRVPGRLEPVENSVGAQVVVDYCHTPDALEKCLETLNAVPHKRIITLFGCGGDRDPKKRPIMGGIALRLSDYVIVTSDNPRTEDPEKILGDILHGMQGGEGKYCVIADRRAALKAGVDLLQEGDVFLVAGKGHETYQILGREKHPFDDREITRAFLRDAGKG